MKKSFITFSVVLVVLLVMGCKTTKSGVSKDDLTSTTWQLSEIGGKSIVKTNYPNGLPDAVFSSDNRISGHGGCNRYGGSYTLNADGSLTLGQMMATKMFCEGVEEDKYMSMLSKVNKAEVSGNNLVLYHDKEAVLTFVPKKAE